MKKATIATAVILFFSSYASVARAGSSPAGSVPFPELAFLAGEWEARGTGRPGESVGHMKFFSDLNLRVLVRRNESISPAGRHEDLTVIYKDPTRRLRADFYDSEGHVIRYTVTAAENPARAVFLSEPISNQPSFRYSYALNADGTLALMFEIAPPGTTNFATYLSGTAKRAQ
jgi:hypothetical protein